jgi:hypothetical protein
MATYQTYLENIFSDRTVSFTSLNIKSLQCAMLFTILTIHIPNPDKYNYGELIDDEIYFRLKDKKWDTYEPVLAFIKSKEILNPTIIVPAVSWSTTYTPAWYLGFKLKFVDIDPDTFGLSSANVEAAIDGNTVAILTVNLLGSASDLSNLTTLAKKHNIFLLEDNCES